MAAAVAIEVVVPTPVEPLTEQDSTSSKQFIRFRPWLCASATVEQGNKRPTMEDRVMIGSFAYHKKTFFVFLLLDGHGGAQVADFARENFIEIMGRTVLRHRGYDVRRIIRDTFVEINRLVSQFDSGSTASLVLVIENPGKAPQVWIANVGDSPIYGITYDKGARKLSVDHNVKLASELSRITHGGNLSVSEGYVCTKDGHMLAVTRALGDNTFGPDIIAEPTIKRITTPYPLIAVASDGITDVMGGAVIWQRLNPPKERQAWRDSAYRVNRWRNETFPQHDNTSLILVFIDHGKISN